VDVEDLVARFSGCTLPKPERTHHAHLTVGLWHVRQYGADEALTRLRAGIRRLNDSHGTPNSATRGYHETITRAYVMLLTDFLASCPESLDEQVARLLQSPVAEKDYLLRFYSSEQLMSPEARAGWVAPLSRLTLE
jgi:hypothetical protein